MTTATDNQSGVIKFGSSPSLAMMVKLIAKFYCTSEERIQLAGIPAPSATDTWRVINGDKPATGVVVCKRRGRFVFQTAGVQA